MPLQSLNDQLTSIANSLGYIIPEIILCVAIFVVLVIGLFRVRGHFLPATLTMITALVALILVASGQLQTDTYLFNRLLHRDGLADFLMMLVDVSVILTCAMSWRSRENRHATEYYALILAVALGAHVLLMSASLLMLFLSLELISISSYVLAGYAFNRIGSEGSLKYFFFGSVATATMLYGFTVLYGFTGTVDFTSQQFSEALIAESSPLVLIGGLMALCGLLFKIAAVPMQPWAPDVYEAAPMPVIAYLSVAPKLASLGILAKLFRALHVFGQGAFDWQIVAAVIAVVTIAVGNLSGLWQKNPKRMMAYSSIAQSGFLLVGIAAFLPHGLGFMLFYCAIYLVMNFCVFIYLAYFEERGYSLMHTYAGAGRKYTAAATGLTVGLVALTALPPTAGFTAKLLIFSGLWDAYQETDKMLLLWLLIFGLLNTVISLFYYMRIPYYAFLKAGEPAPVQKKNGFENFLGLILVLMLVALFFIPGLLMGLINRITFVQ